MNPTLRLILTDYQIIVSVLFLLAAWRWGDWKNWRLYYPTMLFFTLGDLSCSLATYNYPLWEFESPLLKSVGSDFLITLVFFPATVLLYLPHFPKKLIRQVLYIFLWVSLYTMVEILSFRLGFFSYHNGWSIGWSFLFNCFMFSILWIHHKRPLAAIGIAFVAAVVMLTYFQVPFSSMK